MNIHLHDLTEIRQEQRVGNQRVLTQLRDVEGRTDQRLLAAEAKLTDASAKDVPLEWVGVILLLIGMLLSTAAPEIAGWLGAAEHAEGLREVARKVAYPKKIESAFRKALDV